MSKSGSSIFLHDDSSGHRYPFACQLVSSTATSWVDVTVLQDSTDNYVLLQNRSCVIGNLGKPRACFGPRQRTFSYFWIMKNMTFLEARDNCHNMSGKLFDYFDGTRETIEFLLVNMLPVNKFWVGLEISNDHKNTWISEDEQNLQWAVKLTEKSLKGADDKYLAIDYTFDENKRTSIKVLVRLKGNETLPSVCYRIDNVAWF